MHRSLSVLVLLLSVQASADRREFYVQLEGDFGIHLLKDAPTAQQSGVGLGPAGELQVFYGLTNSLHVGLYGRGFYSPDVAFQSVRPTLADGSQPTGTLYENAFGFGGGALARWRFDLGFAVAPFAQLELGFVWSRFTSIQLVPSGRDFALAVPSRDVLAPDGRLSVGGEYRLGELIVLGVHVGVRRSISTITQWQIDAGIAVGVVL